MVATVAEDLGRVFEVGFNVGILAAIAQENITHHFGDRYQQDLQNLEFSEILDRICRKSNLVDPREIERLETWGLFLLQKGWLSGLNFFREYLTSFEKPTRDRDIIYYQCCFTGDNSVGTLNQDEPREIEAWLSQLGLSFTDCSYDHLRRYRYKGGFLKADTLILLRHRRKLRLLVVDLSVFSVREAADLLNLQEPTLDSHRRLLRREISYLKSKSVFASLRLDNGEPEDLDWELSNDLRRYFTAFKRKDKEVSKLIQAGSYGYSFYQFLQDSKLGLWETLGREDFLINVVGYSDRSLSIMSLNPQHPQHLKFLTTCQDIYHNEPRDVEITAARQDLLRVIRRNASRSFQGGREFVRNLSEIQGDKINVIPPHQEVIEEFASTLALRSPHAEAVQAGLTSDTPLLFLTGNPGIGKTTAIVEFLKSHVDDGFLFFYVSPRKQVNLDIIEKFKDSQTQQLCDPRLLALTTNSALLDRYPRERVVNTIWGQRSGEFSRRGVRFIPFNESPPPRTSSPQLVHRETDRHLRQSKNHKPGVLSTLCEGIYTAIQEPLSNAIIATACIQALRITENNGHTLRHFERIFNDFYYRDKGEVNFPRMREMSSRIKHLFIMIDEVTGDQSGVDFLHAITDIIHKYELNNPQSGFNLKVIVADASIVDQGVIQQHLSDKEPEPDKIFVRHRRDLRSPQKIQVESLEFRKGPLKTMQGQVINANSYPANRLRLIYKVFVESVRFEPEFTSDQMGKLARTLQSQLLEDLNELRQQNPQTQILVYIQDKQRLQELIKSIQDKEKFEKYEDYLEVHADLSDEDRGKIQEFQDRVQVVFMTSSASRGLSFPKAQHILLDVPRFQVEQNLMEIIQVMYRCRGQFWENDGWRSLDESEKAVTFYLGDRAVYYDEEHQDLAIQESLLSLLTLLVILKTAIMTRIAGSGKIGREQFMMIPIGGKSVSMSGQSLSGQLAALIDKLQKEYRRDRRNTTVKELAERLRSLLSQGEFLLTENDQENKKELSYLGVRSLLNQEFANHCNPLAGLLTLPNLELGHICGSLLLVHMGEQRLSETYTMGLRTIQTSVSSELLQQMIAIQNSSEYSPNLQQLMEWGIQLIRELQSPHDYTQRLQQGQSWSDQYYAIPLFAFLLGDIMAEYFQSGVVEPEKQEFRLLLKEYLRQLYPSDNLLPIGDRYREFPFLIFRSYSLQQMRSKLFTSHYLITSNELNLLNLILGTVD